MKRILVAACAMMVVMSCAPKPEPVMVDGPVVSTPYQWTDYCKEYSDPTCQSN